jgi:hypothetical protein
MYEIKIIPAEHVCNADKNSFNTMQRNLKYKSIITVEKQLNFAAVVKYSFAKNRKLNYVTGPLHV